MNLLNKIRFKNKLFLVAICLLLFFCLASSSQAFGVDANGEEPEVVSFTLTPSEPDTPAPDDATLDGEVGDLDNFLFTNPGSSSDTETVYLDVTGPAGDSSATTTFDSANTNPDVTVFNSDFTAGDDDIDIINITVTTGDETDNTEDPGNVGLYDEDGNLIESTEPEADTDTSINNFDFTTGDDDVDINNITVDTGTSTEDVSGLGLYDENGNLIESIEPEVDNNLPEDTTITVDLDTDLGGTPMTFSELPSPWQYNGSNIYYLGGNVGIGTDTPDATLTISPADSAAYLKLTPSGNNLGSIISLESTDPNADKASDLVFSENGEDKWHQYYSSADDYFGIGHGGDPEVWSLPILAISDVTGSVGIYDIDPDYSLEVGRAGRRGYLGVSSEANNDGDIFVVDLNNNVGIGNPNPTEKLEVNGNIKVSEGSDVCVENGNCLSGVLNINKPLRSLTISPESGHSYLRLIPTATNLASNITLGSTLNGAEKANSIIFSEFDTEKWSEYYSSLGNFFGFGRGTDTYDNPALAIEDTNGNVGVGDTSADYSLEIAKNTDKGYFAVSSERNSDGDIFVIDENGNAGLGNINPTEKLDIVGNIKVSEGSDICIENGKCLSNVLDVTRPLDSLTIAPDTSAGYLKIQPKGPNSSSNIRLDSTDSLAQKSSMISFSDSGVSKWEEYYSSAGDFIAIGKGSEDGTNPSLAIDDSTGNVGIRETSADYALEVATSSSKGYLAVSSERNNDGDVFVVDSNKNVGINNANPTEKLEVDGNVKVGGNIVSDGDICIGKCDQI